MGRRILVAALFCLTDSFLLRAETVEEIVDRVDRLYRSETSYAEVEIRTPHWTRGLRMEMWSRGRDETFIYIAEPKKEAGIATLRKKKEMWNYFPKINKVMKVPPSIDDGVVDGVRLHERRSRERELPASRL